MILFGELKWIIVCKVFNGKNWGNNYIIYRNYKMEVFLYCNISVGYFFISIWWVIDKGDRMKLYKIFN